MSSINFVNFGLKYSVNVAIYTLYFSVSAIVGAEVTDAAHIVKYHRVTACEDHVSESCVCALEGGYKTFCSCYDISQYYCALYLCPKFLYFHHLFIATVNIDIFNISIRGVSIFKY